MNKRQKKKNNKIKNQRLVERYPFLLPKSPRTGKVSEGYDFSYTLLDLMPEGWRKSFGPLMLEELKDALIKAGHLYDYQIQEIKEKYGSLRWYHLLTNAMR